MADKAIVVYFIFFKLFLQGARICAVCCVKGGRGWVGGGGGLTFHVLGQKEIPLQCFHLLCGEREARGGRRLEVEAAATANVAKYLMRSPCTRRH